MNVELTVNNDPEVLPVVESFVSESFGLLSLDAEQLQKIRRLVIQSALDAIKNAYRPEEEGSVTIRIDVSNGKLEISVRDYGMPEDTAAMETIIHHEEGGSARLFGMSCKDTADEVHWIGYGPEGKALRICKRLDQSPVPESDGKCEPSFSRHCHKTAPEEEYTIRRMFPGDGLMISQLIYNAYGGTYFNSDVYYPEKMESMNAKGTILSFVAVDGMGNLVGHYALERKVRGPVVEGGEAVVDPAHRGKRLLERMKEAALAEARRIGLVGVYANAVAVHPYTQKSNVRFGARLACANLGISPRTEKFLGLSGELPQRVSCMLYYLPLVMPEVRTVYPPVRHRAMIDEIYENLRFPLEYGAAEEPQGKGEISVSTNERAARSVIRVKSFGEDTVRAVRHSKRELTEHSHIEVVFVDLPLGDPSVPSVVEGLEEYGFSFAGIAPHFSGKGDVLRLVYLTEPLLIEHIVTYEDIARHLVEYVLAEQVRVKEL